MENKTLLPYELSGVVGTALGVRMNYKEFCFEEYCNYDVEPPEKFKLEFQRIKSLVMESWDGCIKNL